MSGQPYRYASDAEKYRTEYMANLNLRADLDDKDWRLTNPRFSEENFEKMGKNCAKNWEKIAKKICEVISRVSK